MSTAHLNRGVIWGQLLANLDRAREALRSAQCHSRVLDVVGRRWIDDAVNMVTDIEKHAWMAQRRKTRKAGRK
ncbi:MAG TPA: hypothetical protein VFO62_10775 [Candidatus Binatia bacterium]|nr:hypothetical protein [Candidatus Binatia bacterium]